MTSIRFGGRKVMASDFMVEKVRDHLQYQRELSYPHGCKPMLLDVPEYRNNSTWALIKSVCGNENYGVMLQDTYGKGRMITLTVPDSFSDLYNMPESVLTRIRAEFPVGGMHLEGGAETSLFVYDNDTFIVYPYVDNNTQPATVRLHITGKASSLKLPVEGREMTPLYTNDTETVFELPTYPGKYVLYQIVR